MSIYLGQRIPVTIPFSEIDPDTGLEVPVDLTSATIRFDYWYPTNKTNTKDGDFVGAADGDPLLGIAKGSLLAAENTVPGNTLRIQGNAIISGDEWPAKTELNIEILERGTIKN